MCVQISDKLLFNNVIHAIPRISLYKKKGREREARFEFTPRSRSHTGDADGYNSEWEIVDNFLVLRGIIAAETIVFNPPQPALWFCGNLRIGAGDNYYIDKLYAMVHHYTELELRFQHGKLVKQILIDKTAEVERLRAQNKAFFGPLEEGKVYLI